MPHLQQYHPDMNKADGAEEKFKEISAAYEVYLRRLPKSFFGLYFLISYSYKLNQFVLHRSYQMKRKDHYMIDLGRQVYKGIMMDQVLVSRR